MIEFTLKQSINKNMKLKDIFINLNINKIADLIPLKAHILQDKKLVILPQKREACNRTSAILQQTD